MKNLKVTVNGTVYSVQVEEADASAAPAAPKAAAPAAPAPAAAPVTAPAAKPAPKKSAEVPAGSEVISAPMPGTIVKVPVTAGQSVKKDDVLVVLEAMKMENEIMAPHDAKVAAVLVAKGDSVETGAALVSLQ